MQAIDERLDTMRHNLTLIEATVASVRRELVNGHHADVTYATGPELCAAALALIIRSYEELDVIRNMVITPHGDRSPAAAADRPTGDDQDERDRALMAAA